MLGKKQTIDARSRMSKSHKGLKQSAETIEKRVLKIRGEKHYEWKGEKVSYGGLHKWVIKQLGAPDYCAYCGNDKLKHRSYNWANISHAYKRELSDWVRLCVPCHRKYDKGMINLKLK